MVNTDISITNSTNMDGYKGMKILDIFASDYQKEIIQFVNYVILCEFVSVFGIGANTINIVIFCRQGLNSTTNISFFALAVSDMCCLLIQQLFSFYTCPVSSDTRLPLIYTDVQYLTSGVPRAVFSRTTCLITVYMTAERCLCVAFPLHIKQIITPRRTTVLIVVIYSLTLMSSVPFYAVNQLGWNFYPEFNQTLYGLVSSSDTEAGLAIGYFIMSFSGMFSFLTVLVLTSILIIKLKQKSTWRQTVNVKQEAAVSLSGRDRKTMIMVVLIASLLIICYTPSTLLSITTVCEPEFNVGRLYSNLCYSLWSFAFFMETINSSANIFLYIKMSSNYRRMFLQMFSCLHKDTTK